MPNRTIFYHIGDFVPFYTVLHRPNMQNIKDKIEMIKIILNYNNFPILCKDPGFIVATFHSRAIVVNLWAVAAFI